MLYLLILSLFKILSSAVSILLLNLSIEFCSSDIGFSVLGGLFDYDLHQIIPVSEVFVDLILLALDGGLFPWGLFYGEDLGNPKLRNISPEGVHICFCQVLGCPVM